MLSFSDIDKETGFIVCFSCHGFFLGVLENCGQVVKRFKFAATSRGLPRLTEKMRIVCIANLYLVVKPVINITHQMLLLHY